MAQLIKGTKEWFAAKKEARAQLDAKLAAGLPHSAPDLPGIGANAASLIKADTPKAPKSKKPKAPKA